MLSSGRSQAGDAGEFLEWHLPAAQHALIERAWQRIAERLVVVADQEDPVCGGREQQPQSQLAPVDVLGLVNTSVCGRPPTLKGRGRHYHRLHDQSDPGPVPVMRSVVAARRGGLRSGGGPAIPERRDPGRVRVPGLRGRLRDVGPRRRSVGRDDGEGPQPPSAHDGETLSAAELRPPNAGRPRRRRHAAPPRPHAAPRRHAGRAAPSRPRPG